MIHRSVLVFILSMHSAFAPSAFASVRCGGGGEGPKPFQDISSGFHPTVRVLPTRDGIQDFLLWNKRNAVIYRNTRNEVMHQDLSSNNTRFINTSSIPLSQVVDEEERYLLTDKRSWFLDTLSNLGWLNYQSPVPSQEHLFWSSDRLYSIANFFTTSGEQKLQIFRYRAGASQAQQICPNLSFDAQAGYHIGEGNSYPYVFMHSVRSTDEGNELTVFKLNVRSCKVDKMATYTHLIQGDVQRVYWFESLNSLAVKIDHPEKNLLWDSGPKGCSYMNIGNDIPMVLNHRLPILATLNEQHSLSLFYLNAEKKAEALGYVGIDSLPSRDLMLADDGRRLFIAPTLSRHQREKVLLEVKLPPAPN